MPATCFSTDPSEICRAVAMEVFELDREEGEPLTDIEVGQGSRITRRGDHPVAASRELCCDRAADSAVDAGDEDGGHVGLPAWSS